MLPWREGKVDERDFGRGFRRVVWIGKFGRDVELEVLVVRNDGISQLDHQASLLPECLQSTTNKHNCQHARLDWPFGVVVV